MIGVPEELVKVFQDAIKKYGTVGQHFMGGTGISTGNDSKYLKKTVRKPQGDWIRFYRNPGGRRFYYLPNEWITGKWKLFSKKDPNFMLRNSQYFFREGITCSSMGLKFSAVYLPKNVLFGINPSFFHENREYLFYLLGYFNSSIATYFIRAIMNRANIVTSKYIKNIPFKFSRKYNKDVLNETEFLLTKARETNGKLRKSDISVLNSLFYKIFEINKSEIDIISNFTNNLNDRV